MRYRPRYAHRMTPLGKGACYPIRLTNSKRLGHHTPSTRHSDTPMNVHPPVCPFKDGVGHATCLAVLLANEASLPRPECEGERVGRCGQLAAARSPGASALCR